MAKKPGLKNAIKSADFRPKRLTAKGDEVRRLHLGTLIGQATKTFMQPDINDPTDVSKMQEGIIGAFQFTDAETAEVMRAPRLWVPDTIANPVKDALRKIDPDTGEITELSHAVELAFEVYAIRSTAALGYTWLFEPVFDMVVSDNDPIARIEARRSEALALTDQSGAETATPKAPAEKAKAGK